MSVSDFYTRLKVGIEARSIPDDVYERLNEGLQEFERSEFKTPLDICLGIRGVGKESIETVKKRKQRDHYLYQAWMQASIDIKLDDWTRSTRLSEYMLRFQTTTWKHFKDSQMTPEKLSPIQQALFRAFSTGIYIPTSIKQINRICVDIKQGAFHVHEYE